MVSSIYEHHTTLNDLRVAHIQMHPWTDRLPGGSEITQNTASEAKYSLLTRFSHEITLESEYRLEAQPL